MIHTRSWGRHLLTLQLLLAMLLACTGCDEQSDPAADGSAPDAGPAADGPSPDAGPAADGPSPDASRDIPLDAPPADTTPDVPDAAVPDLPPPDLSPDQAQPDARPTAFSTIQELTSAKYTGRKGGTAGGTAAAKYLAARLAACGIKPFGDTASSYLQTFKVTPIVHSGKMELSWTPKGGSKTSFTYRSQWRCGRLSPASKLSGSLVYVGYGMEHAKHNDYKGLDVKGKVVLSLRGCPPAAAGDNGCDDIPKIDLAAKHKAAAIVLISDDDNSVDIWGGNQGHTLYPIPAALIKPGPGIKLLPGAKDLVTLKAALDKSGPQSVAVAGTLALTMTRTVFAAATGCRQSRDLRSAPRETTSSTVRCGQGHPSW